MRTRVVLILLLGWLASTGALAQSTVTAEDLQHHRWVLERIDGEPLPVVNGNGKIPELDFGEQMKVSGNLGCNQMNGQAVLRDGYFLIEAMATTRMMCSPPWSDIELKLQVLLGSESTATLDEQRNLTLTSADTTLVYRLEDWVAAAGTEEAGGERVARGFSQRGSRVGYTDRPPRFGSPTSPAGEMDEADAEVDPAFRFPKIDAAFEPWNNWKREQNTEHGFQLSAHYSTLYQQASDVIGDYDKASSGVLRATALWTVKGRGTPNFGRLNVMMDHRHAYRSVAPADFAGQFGYIGQTGIFYNDIGFAIINLNWQQAFKDGDAGLVVGRYDPNDYQNVLGYVNPWTIFSNLAINLDTSIALPDSSWGIGAGTYVTDQVYVLGGINDANGAGSDDLEFFEGGAEFYKYFHVGWTPSKDERYFKNIHVMAWHVDEREDAGVEAAHGITFAANWTFDDRWMPFARVGFSKGSAPIYNRSVTLGMIHKFMYRSDLVGLSVNHGSPPDDSLSDQTTVEAFWRFQFSQSLAITPSVQLILDPALNSEDNQVWLWGLRARLAF